MTKSPTLPDTIKLSWFYDLCSPRVPGRWFSRHGYWVEVSADNFEFVHQRIAEGAREILFTATRTAWQASEIRRRPCAVFQGARPPARSLPHFCDIHQLVMTASLGNVF